MQSLLNSVAPPYLNGGDVSSVLPWPDGMAKAVFFNR
jgi:hypothetical protein